MSSESSKRSYVLRRRAEAMEETRRRIARATLDLHATVGPARATITAIAERAGVERATVYRHFPDDLSLFRACVSHGLDLYPGPDPSTWANIGDPEEQVRRGLGELYAFYGRHESLWFNVTRDLPQLPDLARANAEEGVFDYFASVVESLLKPWRPRGRRRRLLRAAIGHAVEFQTWHSLVRRQALDDADAIEVVVASLRCLAGTLDRRFGAGLTLKNANSPAERPGRRLTPGR